MILKIDICLLEFISIWLILVRRFWRVVLIVVLMFLRCMMFVKCIVWFRKMLMIMLCVKWCNCCVLLYVYIFFIINSVSELFILKNLLKFLYKVYVNLYYLNFFFFIIWYNLFWDILNYLLNLRLWENI